MFLWLLFENNCKSNPCPNITLVKKIKSFAYIPTLLFQECQWKHQYFICLAYSRIVFITIHFDTYKGTIVTIVTAINFVL